MILAADIGGTSSRLAVFDVKAGQLHSVVQERYSSAEHGRLEEIVRAFQSTHALRIDRACFAVAGPVIDGRSDAPNLPWSIDASLLAREIGLASIGLLNDLEANAYGIAELGPEDFEILNVGSTNAAGNQVVISAGTGLGVAGLYWDGQNHHPFATENGHADFAPNNELEIELLHHLRGKYGHVSWERVVSGPGLVGVYEFLRDTGRGSEPPWLRDAFSTEDPAAVISRAAQDGSSEICRHALDVFTSVYGAEAGNVALGVMATGGVYVGGGIAPKIIDTLKRGIFMEAFRAKGRLRGLLEAMPVRVILNDLTALLGAARWAARRSTLTGSARA
jgi:glucokinase